MQNLNLNLDLNIDHYQLNDLLSLFKIPDDFDENDLKKAKKIVLQTHPDKSHLAPEYFLFFSKAYKMLFGIWEFKNKQTKENTNYDPELFDYQKQKKNLYDSKEKTQILNKFLSKPEFKDTKNFQQWFNEQFEKNKMETEEQRNGYGDWLKSNEDLEEQREIHHTQLGEEIDKKKKQLRALIVHKDIHEWDAVYNDAANLAGEAPEHYSSGLFSQLPYEDLRKAHTETVIPVTMEDYQEKQKFNNVNEYKHFRSSQNTVPLSESQAQEFLNNKYKIQERETTERAYQLAKQLEESKAKQELYWASMKYLSDK
jgi:hypothetical protein